MLTYCLKCKKKKEKKKNAKSISPLILKTKNGGTMILSKCATCGTKRSGFIKKQEAKGLLSNLGLITSLSKIRILGDILF